MKLKAKTVTSRTKAIPAVALEPLISTLLTSPLSTDAERRQYQHLGREILLLNRGTYWMPGENEVVVSVASRNTRIPGERRILNLRLFSAAVAR